MAFLLDSSRKQKQNICDASLFVQSENWIWSRVSRGYNQSLSQLTSIMTDRFIYSQESYVWPKKKRIFSLIFFWVSERYDQWRQTKQIFFTTFVFNFVWFFSSIFFFADLECTFSGVQYSCVIVTRMFVKHSHDL